MKFIESIGIMILIISVLFIGTGSAQDNLAFANTDNVSNLTPKELLGDLIFFDSNLSVPTGQSCHACHGKDVGWSGPNEASNILRGGVYHGANVSRFGNRKPPTTAYSTFAPNFRLDNATTGAFVGGEFWDGRATGDIRGTAPADQATMPFLNPLEMNNPNGDAVVNGVCTSAYSDLFKQVWGSDACDNKTKAFDNIAFSIVAFESSVEVSPFTSKYDAYLDGKTNLTDNESKGLGLFKGKAICNNCHIADIGPGGKHPVFTNWIYGNPGTPKNPDNPFYNETEFNPLGGLFIDPGLAGHIQKDPNLLKYQRINYGKFRVPTLRNVDKRPNATFVKRYMHNGFFSSLKDVVHFYNTRDVLPICGFDGSIVGKNCWPLSEVQLTANPLVGHLGLTEEEENDIVAFLGTLSDGFISENESSIVYTGDKIIVNNSDASISGTLLGFGQKPITGVKIDFNMGTGTTTQNCSGITDNSGNANCTIHVSQPLGPGVISAKFVGNDNFGPSSTTVDTMIFSFPSNGDFAIGDKSSKIGATVTFWGASWPKLNSLSGGVAPSAFNGFISNPGKPACGIKWNTSTKDKPPNTLPSYMGVIVSNKIVQSGSTISGNTTQIVVVKTNAGYQPNKGHSGTGTEVATFCG